MLNNVVIVGRLTEDIKLNNYEEEKQVSSVTVAIPRSYKNEDGEYETDFVRCVLWNQLAVNASEYCKVGDVVGIKGRLQSSEYDDENGKRHYVTEVIAEKLTFLSSKPKDEPEEKTANKKDNKNKKKAE